MHMSIIVAGEEDLIESKGWYHTKENYLHSIKSARNIWVLEKGGDYHGCDNTGKRKKHHK